MKNQRRFAPTKTGRLAPEQVAAFLRNQWPESAEYALVAIVKKRMQIGLSLYTILQILSLTLFEKMPLYQAFAQNDYKNRLCTEFT